MISLQEFQSLSDVGKSGCLRVEYLETPESRARRGNVHGIGINDADYMVRPKIEMVKVICPAYAAWSTMLRRARDCRLHEIKPTYIGVMVSEEWHSFMAFRSWWLLNQVDGWAIDKDLLTDCRQYGPETCIFVPSWLNAFTTDCAASRGDAPVGVYWNKTISKYQARCSHPFERRKSLGYFVCQAAAYDAWRSRKLEVAFELKPRMDAIDLRIYPRVVEIIKRTK